MPLENHALQGRVHSFQTMGAVDGPGLRFVVFMQGCPLRCAYCHNPDTWQFADGESYTVEQIMQKVRRFAPYIKKTGGVTVTGGEPLAQAAFITALFAALKREGFHTALDTSGHGCADDEMQPLLAVTDLVLADIKFLTEEDYRQHAHGSFAQTVHFLQQITAQNIPLWVRHVVVPALTDTPRFAVQFAALCKTLPTLQKVELLPFRKLCLEKYNRMQLSFPLVDTPEATDEQLMHLKRELDKIGL